MIFIDKYGRKYLSEELDSMTITEIENLGFHAEDDGMD